MLTYPRNLDGSPRTRDLAWWHIARHTTPHLAIQRTIAAVVGIVVGIAVGLVGGLVDVPSGLMMGSMTGFGAGLVYVLTVGIVYERGGRRASSKNWVFHEPGFPDLRLRNRATKLIRDLIPRLMFWFVVGFMFGFIGDLSDPINFSVMPADGLIFGLIFGLLFGLGLGLPAGLSRWMGRPAFAQQASAPLTNWRADRLMNLANVIIGGLTAGLTFGIAVGLDDGSVYGLAKGLTDGLTVTLAVGLLGGLIGGLLGRRKHRAWIAYVIAVNRLARRHILPLDLMHFLNDAHHLGLLRAVGPIYQFRHAELQDHLAETYRPSREGVSA
jgi:hypothetical protein